MIFKKILSISVLLILISCADVSFVYNDDKNLTNPIYEKAHFEFSGKDIPSLYRYTLKYFGKSQKPAFRVVVLVEEEKIKRSVQSNQAISKLDYNISFFYTLSSFSKSCIIYKKEVFSRFTYVPKSSGYNFGSDQSLIKMYEISAKESLEDFVSFLKDLDLNTCNNES